MYRLSLRQLFAQLKILLNEKRKYNFRSLELECTPEFLCSVSFMLTLNGTQNTENQDVVYQVLYDCTNSYNLKVKLSLSQVELVQINV